MPQADIAIDEQALPKLRRSPETAGPITVHSPFLRGPERHKERYETPRPPIEQQSSHGVERRNEQDTYDNLTSYPSQEVSAVTPITQRAEF